MSDRGGRKDTEKDRHIQFHSWLKSSTWKIYHYVYYFISKIFAVLNTLLKPKQI